MNCYPLRKALNFLLPSVCLICSDLSKNSLCTACHQKIKFISSPQCSHCGIPFLSTSGNDHTCGECLTNSPAFDQHRSAVLYEGAVLKLVHGFKYGGQMEMLSFLTEWLIRAGQKLLNEADFFVPIPLTLSKLRKRTYNQSLLLAESLSKKTGIPYLTHDLIKICETKPQAGLHRKERLKNVHGSFEYKGQNLNEKTILVIDDVFTTGSTLNAAAIALKQAGATRVFGLTLAHSVFS